MKRVLKIFTILLPLIFTSCNNTVSVNYNNPLDPNGTDFVPAQPGAPYQVTATVEADTGVILSWVDTTRTVNGFVVERSTGDTTNYAHVGETSEDTTTYADHIVLEADTAYYYRVAALRKQTIGAYSQPVIVTVSFPAPSKPAVSPLSPASLRITWSYGKNNAKGFLLDKSVDGGAFYTLAYVGHDSLSFLDNDIDTADSYAYEVAAVGSGTNRSPFSPETYVEYTAASARIIGSVNLYNDVHSIVFSPDGSMFAAAGASYAVDVWRTDDQTLVHNFKTGSGIANLGWPFQVAFSPDGKYLASNADGINGASINVWRLSDGSLANTIHNGGTDARSLAITPDDKEVLAGNFTGGITFYSIAGDSVVGGIGAFTQSSEVVLMQFTLDGNRLIAASYGFPGPTDEGIKIWNAGGWSELTNISRFQAEFYSISYDDRYFTENGTLYDFSTGDPVTSLSGFQFGQSCLAYNDELLIGKEYSGPIVIGDAADGSILFTKSMSTPDNGTQPALACSPNSLVFAAAGSSFGEIDIWAIQQQWRSK